MGSWPTYSKSEYTSEASQKGHEQRYSRIIQVIIVTLWADGSCCGIGRIVKLPVYIHKAFKSFISVDEKHVYVSTYVVTSGGRAFK